MRPSSRPSLILIGILGMLLSLLPTYPIAAQPAAQSAAGWSIWPGLFPIDGDTRDIRSIVTIDGDVYVGGGFNVQSASGTTVRNLARWSKATGTWHSLGNENFGLINAMVQIGNDLYIGGSFGGRDAAQNVRRYSLVSRTWHMLDAPSYGTIGDGTIFVLAAVGSKLYVGGDFEYAGGKPANYVASWDGTTWAPLGAGLSHFSSIWLTYAGDFAVKGTDLYVSGAFAYANGIRVPSLARWNTVTETWSEIGGLTDSQKSSLTISRVTASDTALYAISGDSSGTIIFRIDGSGSTATWLRIGQLIRAGPNCGQIFSSVPLPRDVKVIGNSLYVAGCFEVVNEFDITGNQITARHTANNIARWDGVKWHTFGDGVHGLIHSIAEYQGTLFVGGEFDTAGGQHVFRGALWHEPDVPQVADRDALLGAYARLRNATAEGVLNDMDAVTTLLGDGLEELKFSEPEQFQELWFTITTNTAPTSRLARLLTTNGLSTLERNHRLRAALREAAIEAGGQFAGGYQWGASLGIPAEYRELPNAQAIKERIASYYSPRTNAVVQEIFAEHKAMVAQIPNPLPPGYPTDVMVQLIEQQIARIETSQQHEVHVPLADNSAGPSTLLTVGSLAGHVRLMKQLLKDSQTLDMISTLSFAAVPFGVGGVGLLLIRTMPFGVPSAIIRGSTKKINAIAGDVNTGASILSVPILVQIVHLMGAGVEQFASNMILRRTIFTRMSELLSRSSPVTQMRTAANADGNLILTQLTTPDVMTNDQALDAVGTGHVTIRNKGTQAVSTQVFGYVMANVENVMAVLGQLTASAVNVAPGAEQTIAFTYQLPRSTMTSHLGYTIHVSLIARQNQELPQLLGPFVSRVLVGTSAQLKVLATQSFRSLGRGNLPETGRADHTFTISPGGNGAMIMLSFPDGTDADLHLYDAQGRHVGLNKATGITDLKVPNVQYSGHNTGPEWITLPKAASGIYTVTVEGQPTQGAIGYDLSVIESRQLPLLIDMPKQMNWSATDTSSQDQSQQMFAAPVYLSGDIQRVVSLQSTVTDLRAADGALIPARQLSCWVQRTSATATMGMVTCSIRLPATLSRSEYSGSLLVTAYTSDSSTKTATMQIRLVRVDTSDKIYLPLTMR
jgi:hypothetical protein